ncbi:MAG TPA: hypothetical protein VFJ82_09275 [Longimicrobium sp.]|nr:hypothetical protein [Longimicrobium sp.]
MRFHAPPRPLATATFRALALLAALFLPSHASAQPGTQPQRVLMGMYVVDVSEFDLKSGTYSADFYLWARWNGPLDPTNFEVMNGSGEPCSPGGRRQQGTLRYAVFRCHYRFHRSFDLSDYPLDRHELTVEVEDRELTADEMVYVPDRGHTALDPAVALSGWNVGTPRLRVLTHRYTLLGDPTRVDPDGHTPYSRLVLAIPVERNGMTVYVKSFLVMFLSVLVGFIGSAMESRHVEARLGLGVASIFGVVSSYVVVTQALPETSSFTLADQLHLVGMGFVFLSILVSVTMYRQHGRLGAERAERWDRALGLGAAAAFVIVVCAVTALR